jgi:hypothetical protein
MIEMLQDGDRCHYSILSDYILECHFHCQCLEQNISFVMLQVRDDLFSSNLVVSNTTWFII